jgi:hypothetical protein
MHNYRELELQTLIDLLVKHTAEYTRLLSYGVFSGEEFTQCKQALAEIHRVIADRSITDGGEVKNLNREISARDTAVLPDQHDQERRGD